MYKHSQLEDLARRGYRPRVVCGVIHLQREPPPGVTFARKPSLEERMQRREAHSRSS